MALLPRLVNLFFASRRKEIDHFMRHPDEVQARQLKFLLEKGADTLFGREHGLNSNASAKEFVSRIGLYDYDSFSGYVERVRRGERQVIWPEPVKWFAKSSGTTGAKSKYIPVTQRGLKESHMHGPYDIMVFYCHAYPNTHVMGGKMLTLGGSKRIEREGDKMFSGDLSAILIDNTPKWASWLRIPDRKTALIPDFDEKVRKICEVSAKQDVRSFTGVPSWNLVMLNRVLEYTGKSNMLEVWPRMELFVHGGMDFRPYFRQYERLFPSEGMHYMETYNASEGFFAIADRPGSNEMLLMLDYGIYYEFLPVSDLGDSSKVVPLEGVKPGVNYAMIITTSNGLWRYMIGDTVEFVSTDPYRIRITGRTRHYINAFGEEVVVGNAESAMLAACLATGAEVAEYTVAPIYMDGRSKGAHEWVVEFRCLPNDLGRFTEELDRALQNVNSDYEAKRFKDTTLCAPQVTVVAEGTFVRWLRKRGTVGGQYKVPRLYNDRTYADQLIAFNRNNS